MEGAPLDGSCSAERGPGPWLQQDQPPPPPRRACCSTAHSTQARSRTAWAVPSPPGLSMLLRTSPIISSGRARISSWNLCCPSAVSLHRRDLRFPSRCTKSVVFSKLLLKQRLCRMVFFQPSGAVRKKGKCRLPKGRGSSCSHWPPPRAPLHGADWPARGLLPGFGRPPASRRTGQSPQQARGTTPKVYRSPSPVRYRMNW